MSWHYARNGQRAGPVENAELQRLAAAGTVTASTPVWRPGMETWAEFGTISAVEPCLQCKRGWAPERMIPLAGGLVCAGCKPLVLQRMREGLSPLEPSTRFAGFWIRLVARLIDKAIVSVAGYFFQIPLLILMARTDTAKGLDLPAYAGFAALAVVLSLAAEAGYETWFLVKKGATPGKMILGLKVVRARGGSITWGLSAGRFFSQMLSAFTLYFGYLMAGWDDEKRALHDRVCDTRVVFGS